MPEPEAEASARSATPPLLRKERAPRGISPSAARREQSKALTGALSEFGCLNMSWSEDPVMNIRSSLGSRLLTFKWKLFVQMAVMRRAHQMERVVWKRNARWLSRATSKELSWIWGHTGGAAQLTRGATTEHLFRVPAPRARSVPN